MDTSHTTINRVKNFNKLSENVLYSRNSLGTHGNTVNLGMCANLCTESDACISFLYHEGDRFCRLYDRGTPDPSGSTPYTGAVLFKAGEYNSVLKYE